MDQFRPKQIKIDQNGSNWTKMDQFRQKWINLDQNGSKQTKMDQNKPKWINNCILITLTIKLAPFEAKMDTTGR